jgi:hypothetical protein
MNIAIEEATVDAFVAYLRGLVTDGAVVRPAPSGDALPDDAVVCRVASLSPLTAAVAWCDAMRMIIEIGILSPSAPQVDESAIKIQDARTRHALIRGSVLTALSIKDSAAAPEGLQSLCASMGVTNIPTGLAAQLCIQRIPGVWITSAQPDTPLALMEVDAEHGVLVTKISISVIAAAIEIG